MGVVREEYSGKAKRVEQVLWEHGWCVDGITAMNADPEKNLGAFLGKLADLKNEETAPQHKVESRGHILLLSPKYHPEIVGVGIEYLCWGMSKLELCREINDEIPAAFAPQHGRVEVPQ